MQTAHILQGVVLLTLVLLSGCQSLETRRSFLQWNLQHSGANRISLCSHRSSLQQAIELAELSEEQLERLMLCRPAPCMANLPGKWNGVNKGIGPAMANLTQDTKVFRFDNCGKLVGYNQLVEQVPFDQLATCGWQPKTKPLSSELATIGNFEVNSVRTSDGKSVVQLNYFELNHALDPTHYLSDDIVQINKNLLLGRAYFQIGQLRKPIAYFVLFRSNRCDEGNCDDITACDLMIDGQ
jgi:hypothetical protein